MNPVKEEEKERERVETSMRLQVVERYRRVLSAYYVDVFGWNLSEERVVCLGPYSKTITLTWLTPEICERCHITPPQMKEEEEDKSCLFRSCRGH